jgi:hypothetical protein
MTPKEFRERVPLRDALQAFLSTPAGVETINTLERMQRPARITVPGLSPSEYTTLMGTVQIFQTGWNECLNAMKLLTKAPRTGEPEVVEEAYNYLLPPDATKPVSNT